MIRQSDLLQKATVSLYARPAGGAVHDLLANPIGTGVDITAPYNAYANYGAYFTPDQKYLVVWYGQKVGETFLYVYSTGEQLVLKASYMVPAVVESMGLVIQQIVIHKHKQDYIIAWLPTAIPLADFTPLTPDLCSLLVLGRITTGDDEVAIVVDDQQRQPQTALGMDISPDNRRIVVATRNGPPVVWPDTTEPLPGENVQFRIYRISTKRRNPGAYSLTYVGGEPFNLRATLPAFKPDDPTVLVLTTRVIANGNVSLLSYTLKCDVLALHDIRTVAPTGTALAWFDGADGKEVIVGGSELFNGAEGNTGYTPNWLCATVNTCQ